MLTTRLNREHDTEKSKDDAGRLKEVMAKNTENRQAARKAMLDNLEEARMHETTAASALAAIQVHDSSYLKRTWRLETRAAMDSWARVTTYARALAALETDAKALNARLDEKLEEWRSGKAPPPALLAQAQEAENWRLKPLESEVNLADIIGRAERAIDRLRRENPYPAP
jgi:hypothetical protein